MSDVGTASSVTSLWTVLVPVMVGGGLTIAGGFLSQFVLQRTKDAADRKQKRTDKLEELVSAVYDYDHWLNTTKHSFEGEVTMSLFVKILAIPDIYFPDFRDAVGELRTAADKYVVSMLPHAQNSPENTTNPMVQYIETRDGLLRELGNFARRELQ